MRYRTVEYWNGYEHKFRCQYEAGPDVWVYFGPDTFLRAHEAEQYIMWERDHRQNVRVLSVIGEPEQ